MLLETPRLTLRPISLSDLEGLASLFAEPKNMEHFSTGGPQEKAFARELLEDFSSQWQKHGSGIYAICPKGSADIIGFRGVQEWDEYPGAVFTRGMIDHRFRRQGYSTEAALEIYRSYFENVSSAPLLALTHRDNVISQQFLAHLGCQPRGDVVRWDMPLLEFGLPKDAFLKRAEVLKRSAGTANKPVPPTP